LPRSAYRGKDSRSAAQSTLDMSLEAGADDAAGSRRHGYTSQGRADITGAVRR